jgi:transcriptional regulator with XRE-family HTH domain
MAIYRQALGEILKEHRANRGWTLRRASQQVPMALGYLSEIERGQKELSSEMLEGLAQTYGVTPSSIVIEAGVRLASWELPNTVPDNLWQGTRGGVLVK